MSDERTQQESSQFAFSFNLRWRRTLACVSGYLMMVGQVLAIYGITPEGPTGVYCAAWGVFGIGAIVLILSALGRKAGSGGYPEGFERRFWCGVVAMCLPIGATIPIQICGLPAAIAVPLLVVSVIAEKYFVDRSRLVELVTEAG